MVPGKRLEEVIVYMYRSRTAIAVLLHKLEYKVIGTQFIVDLVILR
ncbi:hypothetical protein APHWI1_1184 [Anaplasma phagocytophilum str. ApWI1]|uniref:Uncharacterized protein n=2 Tax=Anaplasma phagocytophilum TaxID=948 RepID=A0A0F3NKW5_ANAPH|nr:hypothetical protein APHWEB_0333 [Anaplasma phagocytophilum str. Webster]KJV68357.1 hypothetical protein EPHNCH_0396 [Anaplasma phagocytophilum str. NCH-1]KJV82407.1 hypothetical protein APHHGE2_0409 [Anaplasma phagocytophilum str. HGE2]KJV84730.1 hypothetical protein APHWI1_1184 [Anaplasma phagocytophilum str. ApWI1]KJV88193.1 hypothetical protein APHNYW_0137 [Anaplasma phagocytophilum str. ApNYW]KJV99460.1 hypothetical protein OTSANNIE_0381 [Anaplasma phagocytophilum str. Annie]KJZ98624.